MLNYVHMSGTVYVVVVAYLKIIDRTDIDALIDTKKNNYTLTQHQLRRDDNEINTNNNK